ncbi:hypothetical protein M885DRAFT_619778 [Pelagophyceae sp. CCMP2097]|nr:hypothetical protein M885DRAFT_619778 [Pelagophyceae sp. CCMP2097]
MKAAALVVRGVLARWGEDEDPVDSLGDVVDLVRGQAAQFDAAALVECLDAVYEFVVGAAPDGDAGPPATDGNRVAALRLVAALLSGADRGVAGAAVTAEFVRRTVGCLGDDAASAAAVKALVALELLPDARRELDVAALAELSLLRLGGGGAVLSAVQVYTRLATTFGRSETRHSLDRAEAALVPLLAHADAAVRAEAAHAVRAVWHDDRRAAFPKSLSRLCNELALSLDAHDGDHCWRTGSRSVARRAVEVGRRLDGVSACIAACLAGAPGLVAMRLLHGKPQKTGGNNQKAPAGGGAKDGAVAFEPLVALLKKVHDKCSSNAPHLALARPALRAASAVLLGAALETLGPLAKRYASLLAGLAVRGAFPDVDDTSEKNVDALACVAGAARCFGAAGAALLEPALSRLCQAVRASADRARGAGDASLAAAAAAQGAKPPRSKKRRKQGAENAPVATPACGAFDDAQDFATACLSTLAVLTTHCGAALSAEARDGIDALLVDLSAAYVAQAPWAPQFRGALLALASAAVVAPLPVVAGRSRAALEASKRLAAAAALDADAHVVDAAARLDGVVATVLRPRCAPLRPPAIVDARKFMRRFDDEDEQESDDDMDEDVAPAADSEAAQDDFMVLDTAAEKVDDAAMVLDATPTAAAPPTVAAPPMAAAAEPQTAHERAAQTDAPPNAPSAGAASPQTDEPRPAETAGPSHATTEPRPAAAPAAAPKADKPAPLEDVLSDDSDEDDFPDIVIAD